VRPSQRAAFAAFSDIHCQSANLFAYRLPFGLIALAETSK
jgi:hypothetical protein